MVELYPNAALEEATNLLGSVISGSVANEEDMEAAEEMCWWASAEGGGGMVGDIVGRGSSSMVKIAEAIGLVFDRGSEGGSSIGMMAAAGELWRRLLYLWRPPRGGFRLFKRREVGSRMGEEEGDEQDDGLESMAMEVLRLISHASEAGMAAICGSAFSENMPHPSLVRDSPVGFRV